MTLRARLQPRLTVTEQAVMRDVVRSPDRAERSMNGWLMWGLILPVLLVVAGIVTIRRRNDRR